MIKSYCGRGSQSLRGNSLPESDDSTSEEATLSETREAERLISSRTVCRIMASITEWYVKMAVLKTTNTTREHNSKEKTGDDPKLKLTVTKIKTRL